MVYYGGFQLNLLEPGMLTVAAGVAITYYNRNMSQLII